MVKSIASPSNAVGSSPSFKLGYRPALDGFRGLAILLVIPYNLHWGLSAGYLGVDLFFLLSGFLITSLLLEERAKNGRINFRAFYIRRALRLLPALVIVLTTVSVAATLLSSLTRARDYYLASLTALFYFSNWVLATGHYELLGILGHTWSLAVEEQFYLLWPPALALLTYRRFALRRVMAAAAVVIGLSFLARFSLSVAGAAPLRIYAGTDTRADTLMIGCLLAALVHSRGAALRRLFLLAPAAPWIALGLVLFAAAWFPEGGSFVERFGFSMVAIFGGLVMANVVVVPDGRMAAAFSLGPLVRTGQVSYGLYLWHPVIAAYVAEDRLGIGGLALELARIVILVITVYLSWRFVETPALRLKKRWARAAPKPTPVAPEEDKAVR